MANTLWISTALSAAALIGCGGSSSKAELVSVGTYIGGGSIFGPETCTYAGDPGVFSEVDGKKSTEAHPGPRFIVGPGAIKTECKSGAKLAYKAVAPTGVKITGPDNVKAGGESAEPYRAVLVAGNQELGGQPSLDWQLGPDCGGVAEFGPVLGAQDTGGPDKTRDVRGLKAGTCTVALAVSLGESQEGFKELSFKAERKVAIK